MVNRCSAGQQRNSLGIQLHSEVLECLSADLVKDRVTVKLPLPTPVLLNTDKETSPRWESLWLGKKIRLIPNFTWLSLQTLDGQLYRFTVKHPKPTDTFSQTHLPALQLLYMPEDREQAVQISELLKLQGIDIELVSEPTQLQSTPPSEQPIIRLWSRASANYWQQSLAKAEDGKVARGLLLRTDPQVELPVGYSPSQSLDMIDWRHSEHPEAIVAKIRDWLNAAQHVEIDPISEIEDLLKKLENPDTKPRQRLAALGRWS